ncbi:MAG: dienelactone hydrolase family protein [Alphaproteobacteria bacterium]|nr:dienelactone hydrolase family protein [Alphaproteobacteria bacterium]
MAEIKIPYEYDGRQFEGALVYDDSVAGKRPAVFMQPDWFGVCRHSLDMATEVAGSDYVVMVADMYGVGYGEREKSDDELLASAQGVRRDLKLILGCGAKAYEVLTAGAAERGLIDTDKTGAIGFCMGGGFALEQARAGSDFKGTVVFHVTAPNPVDPGSEANFNGRVLALHGSADPVTPKSMMDSLEDELTGAGVDWQFMMFGHAMHSFCVKGANNPPVQVYDEKLCQQSYRMMRDFFAETF